MSWFTIISSTIAVVLTYWLYWRWTHRRKLELAAQVPGPPTLPFVGNALVFLVKPGDLLERIAKQFDIYGQYVRLWLGPDLNICVKNPTDIRTLLTSPKVNHKGPLYDVMVDFIGPGILTGGPTWRSHRKIATPSYNKKAVEHFSNIFNIEAQELAMLLADRDPKTAFDIYYDVVKFTTQCVNQTLMGLSKQDSQNLYRLDEMVAATRKFYDLIFMKMTKWWLQIPLIFWLLGWKKRENYFRKLINDFSDDVVKKRTESLEKFVPDEESLGIVDRYILSGELSEREIRHETFSLFTTSQEAAAKMTSGVLTFLSHLPDWQERVYNEIIEVLGPTGPVTSEQVKQLHYLDMVYKETLRCLSIAAMIQRTVEDEITINEGKFTIPAGTSLIIPIHHLHRDPQYWEDPWTIKPERFLPENVKKRDPNAFVPFSLGPMDCLGRVFATALVKTIVVWVIRHVRLEPVGTLDDLNKLHVGISVSLVDGYNVRVIPRKGVL